MDMKFEVAVLPVADVGRAKAFYQGLGWRLDADFPFDNGFRVVQFTPPGSGCSIQFGAKITSAVPGSARGLYLIVSDLEAARADLAAHGAEVSEVFHAGTPGAQFQPDGTDGRVSGPDPENGSYRSFATFNDPDGNGWLLQEITERLPGRVWQTGTRLWPTCCMRRPNITARLRQWPHRMTGGTGMRRTWRLARAETPRRRLRRPLDTTWRRSSTSSFD